MPINVLLIESTLHGTVVEYHPDVDLLGLLPEPGREGFIHLSAVDQYADTFFNYIQIDRLLEEWSQLYRPNLSENERMTLQEVERLARRARDERLILKFVGD